MCLSGLASQEGQVALGILAKSSNRFVSLIGNDIGDKNVLIRTKASCNGLHKKPKSQLF